MVSPVLRPRRMRVFLNLQLKFNIVQTQLQDEQRLRVDSGLLPRLKLVKSKVDLPHRKERKEKERKGAPRSWFPVERDRYCRNSEWLALGTEAGMVF